jgi:DHA2 family multidrug resistance protein
MIDLRLFANREFTIGNVLSTIAGASNYGIAFIGPLFLQQILGFSPFETAVLMIPGTLGLFAGNRFQDYFSRRASVYVVVFIGMMFLAAALWLNALYADRTDFTTVAWLRIVQGIAFGIFVVPTGVFAFKTIRSNTIDAASGLFALLRQVSGMIGIALLATLLEDSQNRYFQQLLLDVPRWPLLLHRSAPSRADTVASIHQHALVMGYQHVYAISAIVVAAVAIVIALYGICESSPARLLRNRPADAV